MPEASQLVWLGLSPSLAASRDEFEHSIRVAARQLGCGNTITRPLFLAHADPAEGTQHREAMAGGPIPYDAIIELSSSDPALFNNVAKSVGDINLSICDLDRSGVIAGSRYHFVPFDGPNLVAFWHRPAQGRSLAACQSYWLNEHGKLGETRAHEPFQRTSGYEQFHTNPADSQRIAEASGAAHFDYQGAVRSELTDVSAYNNTLRSDFVVDVALPDERNFIDHGRSFMALYQPK